MKLYLRILRYVRPHLALFAWAILAMTFYAALDAFSFTLLIPFLNLLFGGEAIGGGAALFAGARVIATVGWSVGWLIAGRPPMEGLRNVVIFLFAVFLVKNVALYIYQVSISVVEGRVTRDMRNDIYAHLLHLGFPSSSAPARGR
jgi:subfamily B ATP-binding cassette protein MsbA